MRRFSITPALVALIALTLGLTPVKSFAQTENILYEFAAFNTDADVPFSSLIFDAAGNLYGTTFAGGTFSQGAIFELSPLAEGGWREKILHSFNCTGSGGCYPLAGLVMDSAGNLYGTAYTGGQHNAGTAFELVRQANNTWSGKILHQFGGSADDGIHPESALVFDTAGNLYGNTYNGGAHAGGTTFELSPAANGLWQERLLHAFRSGPKDGESPIGTVSFDAAGNLYGVTVNGGAYAYGTAYKLTPSSTGPWPETVLHSFNFTATDGASPEANLIFDGSGNLYGTTAAGGPDTAGAVFELTPSGSGNWTETILYFFQTNGVDGTTPGSGLVFDASGNLYGVTDSGGVYNSGTVYELKPTSGSWTENIVHNFDANGTDGSQPSANLILDGFGNLYGTAAQGGTHGGGIVFEITP